MSKHFCVSRFLVFVFLLLTACGPQASPVPVITQPVEATATQAPIVTEVPTQIPPTPTLEPIVLVGPEMKVGSTYLYVDGSLLVAVPAGEFIMGHGGTDSPVHTVALSDFWIYRTEVTNAQYARCVGTGNCSAPDLKDNLVYTDPLRSNNPVVGVNYDQAAAYCKWVNGRLPTEAEWEKTARGPDGNIYPWGDASPSCDLLNFGTCVNRTTDVMKYPLGKSYYEALDMAGNSYEWVADWYKATYYSESPGQDPVGPETGLKRSARSNGFNSAGYLSESARRFALNPVDHRNDLGFRCVVEDPTWYAPFCETVVVYGSSVTGDAQGGEIPESICPDLSISQAQYCGPNNTPLTNVTFSGPDSAVIDAGGCTSAGGNLYVCSSSVAIKICADCELPPVGPAGCTDPYQLSEDGESCVYSGAIPPGTACLPGYAYSAVENCCEAVPGNASYPLCPTGTYAVGGGCYPYPTLVGVCRSDTVDLKSCTGGGNPGGDCPDGQTMVCRPSPNCPPTVTCPLVCACE